MAHNSTIIVMNHRFTIDNYIDCSFEERNLIDAWLKYHNLHPAFVREFYIDDRDFLCVERLVLSKETGFFIFDKKSKRYQTRTIRGRKIEWLPQLMKTFLKI